MAATTAGEFLAILEAETTALRHDMEMYFAMEWNVAMIGVPYGPALCQAHPPELRGLKDIVGGD